MNDFLYEKSLEIKFCLGKVFQIIRVESLVKLTGHRERQRHREREREMNIKRKSERDKI